MIPQPSVGFGQSFSPGCKKSARRDDGAGRVGKEPLCENYERRNHARSLENRALKLTFNSVGRRDRTRNR
jgi:hypothetical protein